MLFLSWPIFLFLCLWQYNGARTPKAMADAALALLPNHVSVVTAKSHADFLSKNAELPKALLFTAKSSTTALYKALALDLKGRMALGEVRAKKDASLLSEYACLLSLRLETHPCSPMKHAYLISECGRFGFL